MVSPAAPDRDQIACAARTLHALRSSGILVHCLTNMAAAAFTADVLLALGPRPSLTHAPAEVESFSGSADALLVNLGTLDSERINGFTKAVSVMNRRAAPWVLDPVLCDRSRPRRDLALELLGQSPAIIRLNAKELQSLTGSNDENSAHELARTHNTIVMVTGRQDLVTDGRTATHIASGHQFMDLGTAYGCAGAAVTAACSALCETAYDAAVSSLLIFNLAGEIAGRIAGGPGSYRPIFLDTLHLLDSGDLPAANFNRDKASS